VHFYLDASALAKRYAPELGTPVVNHLFARVTPDKFHLFNVSFAEVVSLLVRKKNSGRLSETAYTQAVIDLGVEIGSSPAHKLAADNALVTACLPLIEAHSINSTDAVILRSALDLGASLRTLPGRVPGPGDLRQTALTGCGHGRADNLRPRGAEPDGPRRLARAVNRPCLLETRSASCCCVPKT
jgi:predicted nucleic acid-binding protein